MASKSLEQLVNDIASLNLMELADLTKALEEKLGVSAQMPMMSAGAAAAGEAAPVAEQKTEFKVVLKDAGSEKIKVIKALRTVNKTLGLTEAKALVESAPATIAESAPKEEAEKYKKELEAAGAVVELS